MKSNHCPPVIILVDVLLLLLFVFIFMPNYEYDFGIDLIYEGADGLVDDTIVVVKNKRESTSQKYIVKDNKLIIGNFKEKIHYSGFRCTLRTACFAALSSLIKTNLKNEYSIFLSDKVMTSAFSFWDSYCKDIKCSGKMYIDISNGRSFLCDDNRLVAYDYHKNRLGSELFGDCK